MKLTSKVIVLAGTLILSPFLAESASAQTATATMTVTANVVASCSVVGGTLAFGNYDPIAAGPTDGSLQISVRCTRNTTAEIGLALGSNASGAVRRMTNGADFLSYELFKDPARTIVWGNAGTDRVQYVAANNAFANFTVQGRVSALQDVPVGGFTDTVTITVTF